ncbi:E3 ubiquitin-protein ligase SGR9, amyloplastic-like [Phoenix dactylifera]|uniref:E3 ubiquitin-protein ligase SGR9, amyloplastic-like n=1 Tax=Phoenix dactylifera TaxID=42345 RepID=A0A8B7CAL9_PHODC|nr:E3 ubiquitin-protein ligase SGR9, amyloplastic-like [Phoenix dactylifera]
MDSSPSASSGEAVMAALLHLPACAFSDLTRALDADLRLQRRRLSLLLLSPLHFSRALAHLHSLSLPEKTLLLARLLLRHLHSLLPTLSGTAAAAAAHRLRLRDLDAALLLQAMCDAYDSDRPHPDWHARIAEHAVSSALSPAGLGAGGWAVLGHYVDAAAKCRRLFEVVSGEGRKVGAEVAAAVAAVVALPSVECRSRGRECVICKEEMEVGRDVCELPCGHWFHWGCVLGWLTNRNTCPCCRFELPAEDVFYEMGRMWRSLLRMGGAM